MEHYIKPCAKYGWTVPIITVTTVNNMQIYTFSCTTCTRCDGRTVTDTNLERCIKAWNELIKR